MLYHFDAKEFGEWYGDMSVRLLVMLDVLRHWVGSPISISPVKGALGRNQGLNSESAHNVDRWGEVLAADVFIKGVYLRSQADAVVEAAKKIGFTGIGVYPDWVNAKGETQVGFHFDVRPTRDPNNPAAWGRVNGHWVSIESALNHIPKEAASA